MKTSVSLVVAVLFLATVSTSALQAASQLLVSTQKALNSDYFDGSTATEDAAGAPAQEDDGSNNFARIWYEAEQSRGSDPSAGPKVYSEHEIPPEEFEQPKSDVLGGDSVTPDFLEEPEMPAGDTVKVPAPLKNASTAEAPVSTEEANENVITGVDEFADRDTSAVKHKTAEQNSATAKPRGKATEAEESKASGAEEASEQKAAASKTVSKLKAEKALTALLAHPGTPEHAAASATPKTNEMPLHALRQDSALDGKMATFMSSWSLSGLLYSLCDIRAAFLMLGAVFLIMAMGTAKAVAHCRQKPKSSLHEVIATDILEEKAAENQPCTSDAEHQGQDDDQRCAKHSPDFSGHAAEEDIKERTGDSPTKISDATPPPDEEQIVEPPHQAKVWKQRAAYTGASWLSRKMGLICSTR